MELVDCYRMLGLRSSATFADVKASYRRLAQQYHPDINPNDQKAKEKFIALTEAYKLLLQVVPSTVVSSHPNSHAGNPTSHPTSNQTSHNPAAKTPKPAERSYADRHYSPPKQQNSSQQNSPQQAVKSANKSANPAQAVNSQPRHSHFTPEAANQVAAQVRTTTPKREAVADSTPPQPAKPPNVREVEAQLKWKTYQQLQHFLRNRRFPQAIALAEALAERLPTDVEVRQWQAISYQLWGRALIAEKQWLKARIYLKKALRTDPNNKSLVEQVQRDFLRLEQVF